MIKVTLFNSRSGRLKIIININNVKTNSEYNIIFGCEENRLEALCLCVPNLI